jgi:uncharacterized protein YjbJ (UPF0337 family)
MLLLIILLILLFGGGGFYGYRGGYYGPRGMGLASILVIVLIIFLLMGGGFGHGIYFRWSLLYVWQLRGPVMSGTTDKIKGRVKEAVGVLTDNQRLKDEGKLDQTTGKIKETVEHVIDKAKNAVKGPWKNSVTEFLSAGQTRADQSDTVDRCTPSP